jgi:hypothetical protein
MGHIEEQAVRDLVIEADQPARIAVLLPFGRLSGDGEVDRPGKLVLRELFPCVAEAPGDAELVGGLVGPLGEQRLRGVPVLGVVA